MSFLKNILNAFTGNNSNSQRVDTTEDDLYHKHSSTETFDSMPMDELYFNNVQQHHNHSDDLDTEVHHE